MKEFKLLTASAQTTDAKSKSDRRYRNILANSGLEMESGEIRDIDRLYVMGRDGKLILISKLAKNPDAQAEKYSVNFATNHGHNDLVTGERVVDVEDIIGDAKVWLEVDGLHARVYFANEDEKADHAWAVSENASYSIGTEWYENGYYGAGQEIDGYLGILREISMVDTGNDPRAQTLDHKATEAQAQGRAEAADGKSNSNLTKGNLMKTLDKLTPEEADSLVNGIVGVIAPFVDEETDAKSEETTDSEENTEAPAETKTEAKAADKNVLHQNILVIKDRKEAAHQEVAASSAKAYLKTDRAVEAWGKALIDSKGDAKAWRDNFRKIAKADGVDFGENVSIAPEAVVNAVAEQLRDEDTIFSHVNKTGLAFEVVAIPTSEDGGRGHVRGKTKVEENITGTTRVLTPADLYKLMKLDHSMVKLNGGLGSSAIVRYVLRELPRKLIETIDKGILLGNIQNDDVDAEGGATTFSALNPIIADITANGTYGKEYTPESGDNIRQTVSKAANKVLSGTNRSLIATPDYFTDLENSTTSGGQLLFPNGINKREPNINGIRRIIAPLWLTSAMMNGLDAIVVDLEAYHTVGDSTPESFTDYDIDVNKYVWEAVACIGGGLAAANAAVGIKTASN